YALFSSQAPALTPIVVAVTKKPVASLQGMLVIPDATIEELSGAEIIWIAGGTGVASQLHHSNPLLVWLGLQKDTAQLLCSVCTGAFIAAAAGLLDGYTATTHWLYHSQLALFPSVNVASGYPRYWMDRNRIT